MTQASDPKQRLYLLIYRYLRGEIDTRDFCAQFETTFNLELDKATLSEKESVALGRLFDSVVWYSEYPRDREAYPGYRDETEIRAAAVKAREVLGELG